MRVPLILVLLAVLFSGCSDNPKGFYVELEVTKIHRCVNKLGRSECVVTGISPQGDSYIVNVYDLTAVGDMVYRIWNLRGGKPEGIFCWRTYRSQTYPRYQDIRLDIRDLNIDETLLY